MTRHSALRIPQSALRLLPPAARVLVAVSGGADSLALLLVLSELAARRQLKLYAAHIHHGLRGAAADRDERSVRRLCHRLGIPCLVFRGDVRAFGATRKLGLEEAGREFRYSCLELAAQELDCSRIAVAHTAQDNAETVLMHLVRGAGLSGLAGIPVQRGRVIRPLLGIDRPAIERFLAARRIKYRRDASNQRLEFRRNLVRHRLLPLLRRLNPRVVDALHRLARVASEDDRLLDRQAQRLAPRVARREATGWRLDTRRLLAYNISLRRRILKALLPELDYEGIETVLGLAAGPVGRRRMLKGRYVAWKEAGSVSCGPKTVPPGFRRKLSAQGLTPVPELRLGFDARIGPGQGRDWRKNSGRFAQSFDLSDLSLPLFVRNRRPGDRMVVFGGQERKLKDVLIDDKIPQSRRDRLPVVCDRKGILWVAGSRRAERGRITPETRQVLTLKKVHG